MNQQHARTQMSGPAVCPRCGGWYPAGTRRCGADGIALIVADLAVRRFGPENLGSTIPTVVEVRSGEPREIRSPPSRRWPRAEPPPHAFYEASTRPADSIGGEPTDHGEVGPSALPRRRQVLRVPLAWRQRRR